MPGDYAQAVLSAVHDIGRGSHVVLVNPPIADTREAEEMDLITSVEPFGLLRLATYFRNRGCRVSLVDALRSPLLAGRLRRQVRKRLPCGSPAEHRSKPIYHFGLDAARLARSLRALEPPELIAVGSIFSWHVEAVRECLAVCKDVWPSAHLVVGGNVPTLRPAEFDGSAADEVYRGDVPDAAFLPTAIDLLGGGHRADYLRMIKGCPHKCSYCVTNCLNAGAVRTQPAAQVFRELQDKAARDGTRVFAFYDDYVLFRQRRYLDVFLDRVIEERPGVRLEFPLGFSANVVTRELAGRMRRAGVETMILALETIGAQRSREMHRPHHVAEFLEAVRILKAEGYTGRNLRVFFLIGLPDQTLEELLRGILFLLDLGLAPSLTTYALAPGSGDWDTYRERVPNARLDDFTPGLWRFAHDGLRSTELDRIYRYFHERHYPLARIAASRTRDRVIGAMQRIIADRSYLPENW